jgi:hypothetical protein
MMNTDDWFLKILFALTFIGAVYYLMIGTGLI